MRTVFVSALLFGSMLAATACGESSPRDGAGLPNLADYPPARADCPRKMNVSPWVGTPEVGSSSMYQCVLTIHTCEGVKTFKSAARPSGTGMCDDYWKVHGALAAREICCGGSPK